MEDADIKPEEGSSRLLAALPYLLGWLIGLIIFLVARDRYAKFHALQAVLFGLCLSLALGIAVIIGFFIYIPIFLVTLGTSNCIVMPLFILFVLSMIAINLYLAYLAYSGRAFMIPFIGRIALDHVS